MSLMSPTKSTGESLQPQYLEGDGGNPPHRPAARAPARGTTLEPSHLGPVAAPSLPLVPKTSLVRSSTGTVFGAGPTSRFLMWAMF